MLAIGLVLSLSVQEVPRWKLVPGETLRYQVVREQSLDCTSVGLHRSGRMSVTETLSVNVVRVEGGTTEAVLKLESCKGTFDDQQEDELDERYDSKQPRENDDVGQFGDWAEQMGTTRRVRLWAEGSWTFLDAPDVEDSEKWEWEAPAWRLVFPDALRIAEGSPARSSQPLLPLFALEHGLFPWPMTAALELRATTMDRFRGHPCQNYDLAPRIELATNDPEFAQAVLEGVTCEPAAGKGRLCFTLDGALAWLEIEGTNEVRFPPVEPGTAEGVFRIENRLRIELVERTAPRAR